MRPRIPDDLATLLHRHALRQNRSEQSMLRIALQQGLSAIGAAEELPTASDEPISGNATIPVNLSDELNAALVAAARRDDRSKRSMARYLIAHGLRAMNVDGVR